MQRVRTIALVLSLFGACAAMSAGRCVAQSKPIDAGARKFIDAGNQAWVNWMRSGEVSGVAAVFEENVLDCGATGVCVKGTAAVEEGLKARVAKYGRAESASVQSEGAVQRGDFVYEWGESWATYSGGRKVGGHYLTVWEREADGTWKIFRNMGIPESNRTQ